MALNKAFYLLLLLAGSTSTAWSFQAFHFPRHMKTLTSPASLQLATTTPESDMVESSTGSSSGEWTKSRLHNTSTFRGLAILAALFAAGATSKSPLSLVPNQVAAAVHLLSFGTYFGTVFYTTFVAGLTMFKNLPRKMFGKVQSKLFPKYFALCSATLVLQLVTLKSIAINAPVKAFRALGLGLAMTMLNQFYLEPKSSSIMFERYAMEDEPGAQNSDEYKSLKSQFGKLHGISSLTNLIALCAGVAHTVFLSSGLAK